MQPVSKEQGLLWRLGAGASVAGHLAVLATILLFAGVQPFQSASSKPIEVDLVPQQELDRAKNETVQKPLEIPPSPEPAIDKSQQPPAKQAAPAGPPPKIPPPTRPQQAAASPTQQPPPAQQQAAASPVAPASEPTPLPTAAAPLPPPMAARQAPDITERFQVMLGLPGDSVLRGAGGQAAEGAKIATSDTDKLRAHLRSCASLPGSIGTTDKIKIVMRAVLSPGGRLMAPPALIEASASPKGPALMQAAIGALEACQPYSMLPSDRYKEWRVLDIPFTPGDFTGG